MYIEVGPASIVITTKKNDEVVEPDRERLESHIKEILWILGEHLTILKQKAYKIKKFNNFPSVVKRMIEAVKLVDEQSLTPMASVAGAVSDEIKKFLMNERDFDFISVNNGGDTSIFCEDLSKELKVSIGHIEKNSYIPNKISIRGLKEFGVATSGLGGRSLTLGIAEIGTIIAREGAIADAAATYICNKTNITSKNILRKKAIEIDPTTDIPKELVTVSIGNLNDEEVDTALQNGLNAAVDLKNQDLILDAFIYLKGKMVTTIKGDKNIFLEVFHGNQKDCNSY